MYKQEIHFDLTNFTQPFTECLNRVMQKVVKFFNLKKLDIPCTHTDANVLMSQKERFSKVNTTAKNVVEQL